jgi:hypothetical protein
MSHPTGAPPVDPAVLYGPRSAGWPGRIIRGCALVVLLLAGLSIVGAVYPAQGDTLNLTADLAAGRVDYVEYQPGALTVRWVDDWVLWRQAVIQPPPGPLGDGPAPGQEEQWLFAEVAASGHQVRVVERSGGGVGPGAWPLRVPWGPLRGLAGGVWLLTLLHMLSRGGHRVANRWAWFWLFTVGQVGALLYLIREPVPLWRRVLPARGTVPTRGGVGFAQAVLWAFGSGLLGLGVAELLR